MFMVLLYPVMQDKHYCHHSVLLLSLLFICVLCLGWVTLNLTLHIWSQVKFKDLQALITLKTATGHRSAQTTPADMRRWWRLGSVVILYYHVLLYYWLAVPKSLKNKTRCTFSVNITWFINPRDVGQEMYFPTV